MTDNRYTNIEFAKQLEKIVVTFIQSQGTLVVLIFTYEQRKITLFATKCTKIFDLNVENIKCWI